VLSTGLSVAIKVVKLEDMKSNLEDMRVCTPVTYSGEEDTRLAHS
jgi:hypothetical protein